MEADPLLSHLSPIAGVVDYRGRPIKVGSSTGTWSAAFFIIGVEMAERFAYFGIGYNLITYLTGPLAESTAAAAAAVNTWTAAASILPFAGAFIADSYLGRYRTIIIASILYILGLGMLTFSSSVLPSLLPNNCENGLNNSSSSSSSSCPPSKLQVIVFYISLYLVAFAQGGHKPCVQAFGADQFDQNDPQESKSRSSFFNWWSFALSIGLLFVTVLNHIQDNIGWGLGFGIPCMAMVLALIIFLSGTRTYRYYTLEETSPFIAIGRSLLTMIRTSKSTTDGASQDLEEAREVLRLFPIWLTCLTVGIFIAQRSTFFVKQVATVDRRITQNFQLSPASLHCVVSLSVIIFVPIYHHILVPITRKFTGLHSGITMLQRIGIGLAVSTAAMAVATLVETERLRIAREYGLLDMPDIVIPMSLWWFIPQYILSGLADVFSWIGMQEFFYDQVPDGLRSLGLALYLSSLGVGSLISGLLVTLIDKTSAACGDRWFPHNLNHAHLAYFYWLLAGVGVVDLSAHVFLSQRYVYRKKGTNGHCQVSNNR